MLEKRVHKFVPRNFFDKLTGGMFTHAIERFNKFLLSYRPKTHHFNQSASQRCGCAVLDWNSLANHVSSVSSTRELGDYEHEFRSDWHMVLQHLMGLGFNNDKYLQ